MRTRTLAEWIDDHPETHSHLLVELVDPIDPHTEPVSPSRNRTVTWRCHRGHTWQGGIYTRCKNAGRCPRCSKMRQSLAEASPDYLHEWDDDKNLPETPMSIGAASAQKMWWTCASGHPFQMSPGNRAKGSGCHTCARLNGNPPAAISHPHLLNELDTQRSPDVDLMALPAGSTQKAWWNCRRCAASIQVSINARARATEGCQSCRNISATGPRCPEPGRSLADTSPELVPEWSARNPLPPDRYAPYANQTVWWDCPEGHEYDGSVNMRAQGAGCPYCSGQRIDPDTTSIAAMRPDVDALYAHDLNDTTSSEVGCFTKTKRWWRCPEGDAWQARPADITRTLDLGYRPCPYCSGQRVNSRNSMATRYPELAAELHPTRNGNVDAQSITPRTRQRLWWRPACGHEFALKPSDRLPIPSCPLCKQPTRSKTELVLACELGHLLGLDPTEAAIATEDGRPTQVDIISHKHRLLIEFDGSYWHSGRTRRERDKRKSAHLRNDGWTLIRAREAPLRPLHPHDIQVPFDPRNPERVVAVVVQQIRAILGPETCPPFGGRLVAREQAAALYAALAA